MKRWSAAVALAIAAMLAAQLPAGSAFATTYTPCAAQAKWAKARKSEVRSAERVVKRAKTKSGKARAKKRLARAKTRYRAAQRDLVKCRASPAPQPPPQSTPTPIPEPVPRIEIEGAQYLTTYSSLRLTYYPDPSVPVAGRFYNVSFNAGQSTVDCAGYARRTFAATAGAFTINLTTDDALLPRNHSGRWCWGKPFVAIDLADSDAGGAPFDHFISRRFEFID